MESTLGRSRPWNKLTLTNSVYFERKCNLNSQVKRFRIKIKEKELSRQTMGISDWSLGAHSGFCLPDDWSTECAVALLHSLSTVSPESHSHMRAHSLRNIGEKVTRFVARHFGGKKKSPKGS